MKEEVKEYTVNDYSQIDKHLDQINNREKAFTDKIRIQNFFNFSIAALIFCIAIGLLALLIGWSFRLMVYGPKEAKVIEKTFPHQHTHEKNNASDNNKLNNQALKILNNIEKDKLKNNSVLSDVTAFKRVSTNISIFNSVHTRWNYIKGNDIKPNEQSCYANGKKNNANLRLELAGFKNNKADSRYNPNEANTYNITKKQWNDLVRLCQWYLN